MNRGAAGAAFFFSLFYNRDAVRATGVPRPAPVSPQNKDCSVPQDFLFLSLAARAKGPP